MTLEFFLAIWPYSYGYFHNVEDEDYRFILATTMLDSFNWNWAFSQGGANTELQITVNFDAKTLKLLLKKKNLKMKSNLTV